MNKDSNARLPELPEAEATGTKREIYEEIKRLCGVPIVALIYRHLATIPGGLEWTWSLLRPAMTAGLLQERAWELADRTSIPRMLSIPCPALRLVGITREDEASITQVITAFNRSNPVNIMALRCLCSHLNGDGAGVENRTLPMRHWSPPPISPSLPPMVDPNEMQPALRQVVASFKTRGDPQESPLWPSLYRHLAQWPGLLAIVAVTLKPHFNQIDQVTARFRSEIDLAAAELAGAMTPPCDIAPPDVEQRRQLQSAIDDFTMMIPEMVVVGAMLQQALPDVRMGGVRDQL
jgi:hypothetical protein